MQSVKSQLLEPGYAYIRIVQFQSPTGETLANAIQTMFERNDGPMNGLVLDLRNDPGGLLTGAVAVSAAFLPNHALVVYTEGRSEEAKMRLTASPEDYLQSGGPDYLAHLPAAVKAVPMVVLVNGGSASASEIVAGALQDHHRAVIMGTQTFGKASVQTIMPLGNGTGIKLTTARYYTPNGRSIQAKGIVPDIVLDDRAAGNAGAHLREADLNKHLINDRNPDTLAAVPAGNAFNFTPAARPQLADGQAPQPQPGEVVSKGDYEVAQAIAFLKSRAAMRTGAN
jgi:carboxyl-terminal processing protease